MFDAGNYAVWLDPGKKNAEGLSAIAQLDRGVTPKQSRIKSPRYLVQRAGGAFLRWGLVTISP
jgi:hypothetical protein